MNIKSNLLLLSDLSAIGTVTDAADKPAEILSKYCEVSRLDGLSVLGEIKGESDYTLLIDAHIDEVGFIVTHISENGFLTVQKCGGIDVRHLPSKAVTVHGKEKITGVFSSIPPHLSKGDEVPENITDYKIDTMLGADAKEFVSIGDFVTYKTSAAEMSGDVVTGKAFDDRAGVCIILELAKRLAGKKLPITVKFLLSDAEELGLRGATTSAFAIAPDEAIAIDVSFGNGPDISPYECGKLGDGAMIGISPVLSREISDKLTATAKNKEIKYQTEVMGGKTSTNADVISVSRGGVKTGLLSVPLRNMHTDCEVLSLSDLGSVCDILENYILSGGAKND